MLCYVKSILINKNHFKIAWVSISFPINNSSFLLRSYLDLIVKEFIAYNEKMPLNLGI
jgi:hypothetical protein